MNNTMTTALRALIKQGNEEDYHKSSRTKTIQNTEPRIVIADIRNAAEQAKDTLRHQHRA